MEGLKHSMDDAPFQTVICFFQIQLHNHVAYFSFLPIQSIEQLLSDKHIISAPMARNKSHLHRRN